jgi:hypothetical protein
MRNAQRVEVSGPLIQSIALVGEIVLFIIIIHSFTYLHSMEPYMARKPVDIEIVNDNKSRQ